MANPVSVWSEYTLECAHRLPHVPEGHRCARIHGHTYCVRITLTGPVGADGMLVDFFVLDGLWRRYVYDVFDHTVLNDQIANPTSEVFAREIGLRMGGALIQAGIGFDAISVLVSENSRSGAEVTLVVEDAGLRG